jgi:CelD/BcsL family acetyltransferase involved in cellulose biosynthesis
MALAPVLRVRPLPDLTHVAALWRALQDQAQGSFFQSWRWVSARLEDAPEHTHLLEVYDDETLIGLAFATAKRVWRKGFLPMKLLYFNDFGLAGHDVVCVEYNDFLWHKAATPDQRQKTWQALLALPDLRYSGIFIRSASPQAQSDILAFHASCHKESLGPTHGVDLAAVRQAGGLLGLLSANTRQQIRRSARSYETQGALRFDIASNVDVANDYYQRLCQLHQARWQARGHPTIIDYPAQVAMHQRLIMQGVPARAVHLARISAGERDIGYLFLTCWQGHVDFYLGALRYEEDTRLKPGLIAHWLAVEYFARQEYDYYDFLAGDNQAKQQLGQRGPSLDTIIVRKKRLIFALEDFGRLLKTLFYRRASRSTI